MMKKQFRLQSRKIEQDLQETQVLQDTEADSNDMHELELAKIQSIKTMQDAFKKSLDFMPIVFFAVMFIISFALWWSSFQ